MECCASQSVRVNNSDRGRGGGRSISQEEVIRSMLPVARSRQPTTSSERFGYIHPADRPGEYLQAIFRNCNPVVFRFWKLNATSKTRQ